MLVVDLASDRGSIPRASTDVEFMQRRPEMGAVCILRRLFVTAQRGRGQQWDDGRNRWHA